MSDQSGQRKNNHSGGKTANNGKRFHKKRFSGGSGGGGNKNRRPKTLSPIRVNQKYDNLLEQHLIARKKFFELSGRANDKQLEKAEQNFFHTLQQIRQFEEKLTEWQKEALSEKVDFYPKDTLISSTYNEEVIEVSHEGEFEDPHFLPVQSQADYSHDTEETVGTIEDYKMYKGIQD